jgi:hypothetical protein
MDSRQEYMKKVAGRTVIEGGDVRRRSSMMRMTVQRKKR